MMKVLHIAWKDVVVTFRDRAALILMLAAPFVLTLAMGFVTGRFSGGSGDLSGVRDIPVILVDLDEGPLGDALASVLTADELVDLLEPRLTDDVASARLDVEADNAAAAIVIPAGFSAGILRPAAGGGAEQAVSIELLTSPSRPTTAAIVQSIVEGFLSQVESGRIGGEVAVAQLLASGRLTPQEAPEAGLQIGSRLASEALALITVHSLSGRAEEQARFDPLAYLAPGMALLFLMYTVSLGGSSLLAEEREGTLQRLRSTPTHSSQVLGGKLLGVYLTGVAQIVILISASALLFQIDWGRPLDVLLLVLTIVAGATGWGALLAAVSRTPSQASSLGMALMLAFGILGGSFFGGVELPFPMDLASKITPNIWGQNGFTALALGGTLSDLLPNIGALLAMGAILFSIAVVLFRRRGLVRG